MRSTLKMDAVSAYYNKIFYEYADPRVLDYFMVGSPLPVLIVLIDYWLFIKKIGPAYMKNRPPYDLKLTIQIYNLLQVVVCTYLVGLGTWFLIQKGEYRCMLHKGNSDLDHTGVFGSWLYFILKVIDLLDTVFFVLRKKFTQITALHTYHHTIMVISVYLILRYYPAGECTVLAILNCFVHMFMYSYYFYCICDNNRQNIWWKKYITQLQLVQFCINFVWYTTKFFMTGCNYPKFLLLFIAIQNVVMLKMFGSYYYSAFIQPKNAKSSVAYDNTEGLNKSNGNLNLNRKVE